MALTTRKSLPLTDRDLDDLSKLRGSRSLRAAASAVSGVVIDDSASEAALLRAIFVAGLRASEEQEMEVGYAALAVEYRRTSEERHRVSRRRRPVWADEA